MLSGTIKIRGDIKLKSPAQTAHPAHLAGSHIIPLSLGRGDSYCDACCCCENSAFSVQTGKEVPCASRFARIANREHDM
jgi:hypothetical protein